MGEYVNDKIERILRIGKEPLFKDAMQFNLSKIYKETFPRLINTKSYSGCGWPFLLASTVAANDCVDAVYCLNNDYSSSYVELADCLCVMLKGAEADGLIDKYTLHTILAMNMNDNVEAVSFKECVERHFDIKAYDYKKVREDTSLAEAVKVFLDKITHVGEFNSTKEIVRDVLYISKTFIKSEAHSIDIINLIRWAFKFLKGDAFVGSAGSAVSKACRYLLDKNNESGCPVKIARDDPFGCW